MTIGPLWRFTASFDPVAGYHDRVAPTTATPKDRPPISVMIIDDHEVVRRGIAEVVERSDGMTVVAEAASVAEGVRRAELVRPQVLLVDLQLPDGTGIDIMSRLRESLPESRSIVLTSFDDDDALAEALEVGAAAYLLKSVRGRDRRRHAQSLRGAPARRAHRDPAQGRERRPDRASLRARTRSSS